MRARTLLLVLLSALVPVPSVSAGCLVEPKPFTAKYDFLRDGDLLGSSTMVLRREPTGGWTYIIESKGEHGLAGLLGVGYKETSHWIAGKDRIKPIQYHRKEEIAFTDERYKINFDWSKGTAYGVADGEEWKMTDLPSGTVDRLLVNLKLVQDLSCGMDNLSYYIAEEGELEKWRFKRLGKEQIRTPFGTFETVKVAKVHSSPDRKTLTWFIPELDWLAARIEHIEDAGEERYTMVLRSYEPDSK